MKNILHGKKTPIRDCECDPNLLYVCAYHFWRCFILGMLGASITMIIILIAIR